MIIVVPLAGPDFEAADATVKAERPLDGQPLLRRALESRAWCRGDQDQLIVVLRDSARSRRFAQESLRSWYGWADIVHIGAATGGAALSAAAGLALARDVETPVLVDLADILFDCDADIRGRWAADPGLGGLAVTFRSESPSYSYLRFDETGRMIEAREKRVISDNASAGVYGFRHAAVFWRALAHSIEHRASLAHNGLLFVCPMLNGVTAQALDVRAVAATKVVDIKAP